MNCAVPFKSAESKTFSIVTWVLCRAEVDEMAIAEFPLHVRRHAILVGPGGSTLKRISADNEVRIFIPDNSAGSDTSKGDKHTIQVYSCRVMHCVALCFYAYSHQQEIKVLSAEIRMKSSRIKVHGVHSRVLPPPLSFIKSFATIRVMCLCLKLRMLFNSTTTLIPVRSSYFPTD